MGKLFGYEESQKNGDDDECPCPCTPLTCSFSLFLVLQVFKVDRVDGTLFWRTFLTPIEIGSSISCESNSLLLLLV